MCQACGRYWWCPLINERPQFLILLSWVCWSMGQFGFSRIKPSDKDVSTGSCLEGETSGVFTLHLRYTIRWRTLPGPLTSGAPGLCVQGRLRRSPQVKLQVSTGGSVGNFCLCEYRGSVGEALARDASAENWAAVWLVFCGRLQGIEETSRKLFMRN